MLVSKQYIVLTRDGLQVMYQTEDGKYFLTQEDTLMWVPDFEAERLISLFVHVEHHDR